MTNAHDDGTVDPQDNEEVEGDDILGSATGGAGGNGGSAGLFDTLIVGD